MYFTTGRSPFEGSQLAAHLPATARYVRIVLAADSKFHACTLLDRRGLGIYRQTLRRPTSIDGPVKAISHYVDFNEIPGAAMFAVYRLDTDALGAKLRVPLLLVALITADGLEVIGRVRQVDGGGYAILPDNEDDDPRPVADSEAEATGLMPDNATGYLALSRQRRLLSGLVVAVEDVNRTAAAIGRKVGDDDPRTGWHRGATELQALAATFASLAADAAAVELVLQANAGEE